MLPQQPMRGLVLRIEAASVKVWWSHAYWAREDSTLSFLSALLTAPLPLPLPVPFDLTHQGKGGRGYS